MKIQHLKPEETTASSQIEQQLQARLEALGLEFAKMAFTVIETLPEHLRTSSHIDGVAYETAHFPFLENSYSLIVSREYGTAAVRFTSVGTPGGHIECREITPAMQQTSIRVNPDGTGPGFRINGVVAGPLMRPDAQIRIDSLREAAEQFQKFIEILKNLPITE